MAELVVTRLLQNPLGGVAALGQRGDIVRISDGVTTVYMYPDEFEATSESDLRQKLMTARRDARSTAAAVRATEATPASTANPTARAAAGTSATPADRARSDGSLTSPRRAGRRAEALW